jgi:hypothetical protein
MVRTSGCVGPRTRRIFSAAGPGEGFPRRREFKSSVMMAFGACLLLSGLPAAAAEGASSETEGEGGDRAENSFPVQGEVPQLIPRGAARSDLSGSSGPGLDALLQLPNSFRSRETPSVAGANEAEWRRRFVNSERELSSAREELARSKRELDAVAEGGGSSQWAVAPPGASNSGGPSISPLSFKHREAVRRSREALDAADRALRELRIEADLAGVPPAWRSAAAPGSTRALGR